MLNGKLNKVQLSNLEALFEEVRRFGNEADIGFSHPSIGNDTIVLESGHQPNLLPHSGFWKKIFLLDFIQKKYHNLGKNAIALFGFADYNLSTARLLSQNKLPAFNKLGYEKIGFKISNENVWKRFDSLPRPSEKEWKKEIDKLTSHYKKYFVSRDVELDMNKLTGILEESYDQARNFPDLNAFFISKVCTRLFDLNICFFRYSDIQRKGIFFEEWKKIFTNLGEYNNIYDNTIKDQGLEIPLCAPESLPFWYHCSCGAKVNLILKENLAIGTCRICSKDHLICMDRLEEMFGDMSPNAVARNIIFSEGLGTQIFISGSGGGLEYGKISDEISRKLGFYLPITISWKSRDYYIGPAHAEAIFELKRICGAEGKNIPDMDIDKIIIGKKNLLLEMAADAGEKDIIKKYEGQYKNLGTSIDIIKAVFNTKPSFVDIIAAFGIKRISEHWGHALRGIGEDIEEEHIIEKDIIYGEEDIAVIYRKIKEIHDRKDINTQPPYG